VLREGALNDFQFTLPPPICMFVYMCVCARKNIIICMYMYMNIYAVCVYMICIYTQDVSARMSYVYDVHSCSVRTFVFVCVCVRAHARARGTHTYACMCVCVGGVRV